MLELIIKFAIARRHLILVFTLLLMGLGAWSYQRLPIDAVPDITNVQVAVNTAAPGYTPLEVEQRITFVMENAMSGMPSLSYTRSLSRYGLSQVTVVFDEGTDIYFARQQVSERINAVVAELPSGIAPKLGPIASGLGEIFMFTVDSDQPDRSAQRARLDHPPPIAACPRGRRDKPYRRFQEGNIGSARAKQTAALGPRLLRCVCRHRAR
jgi:cobalt-zinc-cadmium resistance protein CzcA